jgi:hypothetical protein
VIGFGHRATAITILDRVTPVLDHWPVGPLLFMPRPPVFAKCLVDLAPGSLSNLCARHFHFDLVADLGLDRREPRVDVGRSGNSHPVAPFWLYIRVAHHTEHVLERRQPIVRGSVGNLTGCAYWRRPFAGHQSWVGPSVSARIYSNLFRL